MMYWRLFGLCFFFALRLDAAPVSNADFERVGASDQLIDWAPLQDTLGVVVADQLVKHQGKVSGRVSIVKPRRLTGMVSQSVSVVGGAVYDLRAYVKLDAGSARRAFLRVEWFDADMKKIAWPWGTSSKTFGEDDWAQVAGTVVAPKTAQFVRILCVAEDWGNLFEPFDVWFDAVSFSQFSDNAPQKIDISARPISDKRQTRVQIVVQDSVGMPCKDGTVVVVDTDAGQAPRWLSTQKGKCDFVLEAGAPLVGGGQVWVQVGDISAQYVLGDVLSGRIVGRIFDAETQLDQFGFVVVQDSLKQVVLRQACEGPFKVFVPSGTWWITAQAGPTQLVPAWQEVDVVAGDSVGVDLPIRSWIDLKARGWLAGDVNVRGVSGQMKRLLAIDDVVLSARAAGLDWAFLTNYLDATLRPYRFEDDVFKHTNFYTFLGRFFETPLGDVWTMGASAQAAEDIWGAQVLVHKDRGIVGHTRLFTPKRHASGVVFDVLSGPTFDCLDVMSEKADDVEAQRLWFDLLNRGYRIAATASSGAVLDGDANTLPGQFRTYVRLDGDATPGRLAQALSQGHSFVSSGPVLLFSVFAAGPGSDLPVGRKRRATLQAWAGGDDHLTRIELIRNGEVMDTWPLDDHPRTHKLAVTLEDTVGCWYVAKCYGADQTQVALTNPIYFREGDYQPPEPVQAVVRGDIQLADGTPISEAQVLVKNPLGQVIVQTTARNGQFRLWAPPTSLIEVQAKGYAVRQQRIVDNPHLVDLLDELTLLSTSPDTLSAPTTFERITELLKNIEMRFVLNNQ